MKFARFVPIILIAVWVLVSPAIALAHSPVFPEGNHSPATAYQIDDPAKSWAIYRELEHDIGDYYTFTVSQGDRIQLSLLVAESPSTSEFLPSLTLLVPGLTQKDSLPAYVEVPANYGTILVNGTDPGEATYEAFSPGWFYEVGNLNINAPTDGTYLVAVFNPEHNHHQETASYCLVVGYLESFTPLEIILVPYSAQEIYRWEGQNQFVALLPIILTLIIGGAILYWRRRRYKAPQGVSKWLAVFAGLAFLGSAVSMIYQVLLTFTVTGVTGEALITLILIIISIALAVFPLMYAIRSKTTLTPWRRGVLILIGIIALFLWSGMYVGPALAISAALVPPYAVKKK
jgi:hypothetical protein